MTMILCKLFLYSDTGTCRPVPSVSGTAFLLPNQNQKTRRATFKLNSLTHFNLKREREVLTVEEGKTRTRTVSGTSSEGGWEQWRTVPNSGKAQRDTYPLNPRLVSWSSNANARPQSTISAAEMLKTYLLGIRLARKTDRSCRLDYSIRESSKGRKTFSRL